jgi:hypothetical protein
MSLCAGEVEPLGVGATQIIRRDRLAGRLAERSVEGEPPRRWLHEKAHARYHAVRSGRLGTADAHPARLHAPAVPVYLEHLFGPQTGVIAAVCVGSAVHPLWPRRTGLALRMAGLALDVVAQAMWLIAFAVAVMIVGLVLMVREQGRKGGGHV